MSINGYRNTQPIRESIEEKQRRINYSMSIDPFILLIIFNIVLGIALRTFSALTNINLFVPPLLTLGVFTLLVYKAQDTLLRMSMIFIISGLTNVLVEVFDSKYFMVLFLGIPIALMIDNRSRKYLYLPTIFFVGLSTYFFITTDTYFMVWLSLLPLIFFYYKTRNKVRAKATYINNPTAYDLRKKREKEEKQFNSDY